MKIFVRKMVCVLLAFGIAGSVLTSCMKEEYTFSIYIEVGAVTKNSASCIVRIIADSGSEGIYKQSPQLGVIWDMNSYPTQKTASMLGNRSVGTIGDQQSTLQISNLQPNTTYYVQALVEFMGNNISYGKIAYSPVVTFRTLPE